MCIKIIRNSSLVEGGRVQTEVRHAPRSSALTIELHGQVSNAAQLYKKIIAFERLAVRE